MEISLRQSFIYSELTQLKVNEEEDYEYEEPVDGSYTLLEMVNKSWVGDKNIGLARFLDEQLKTYIEKITYWYEGGYLCFHVIYTDNYSSDTKIIYRNKECLLTDAVCNFISGQMSDGYAENGLFLLDNKSYNVIYVEASAELYERDYEYSYKLCKEHGLEMLNFDKYPVYKKIEFNYV